MKNLMFALWVGLATLASCGGETPEDVVASHREAAGSEPVTTAPTTHWWYYGQTPVQVGRLAISNNARLVSLRVQSTNPLLFDVALVSNTGVHAKTWWWHYGLTAQEVADYATTRNARVVNLEPYVADGNLRFAVILQQNVGENYSGWWWYYGQTPSEIAALVQQNNARLIDLRQYATPAGPRYGVVMVDNTGANQTGWWWYYNVSGAQVNQFLTQNQAYLVSVDPANPQGSAFNVVMNRYAQDFGWWWYYGQTEAQVNGLINSNHARVVDVKGYVVNGVRYFAVILLSNTWNAAQAAAGACDANLLASWNTTAPAVGLGSNESIASYDTAIRDLMQRWNIPGGAVAVMRQGRLVLARAYGLGDRDAGQLVNPDSRFRLASLSKQITSAAILELVEQGRLTLTDNPFSLLLPTPNPGGFPTLALASMTIQQLLQHTGGWSRESSQGDPMFDSADIQNAQGGSGPPGCNQIIQYMMTQPVYWTPGTTYDYSNFGYCVLGAVIEKVTGTSYASWVSTNVLAPTGAGGIVSGQTLWPADREVVYYDVPGASAMTDVFVPTLNAYSAPYGGFYLEAMTAHGGWVASPIDLLRFQGGLDGRTVGTRLLDATSITNMTADPGVPWTQVVMGVISTFVPSGFWYGMGWANNTGNNWSHFGNLPGVTTEQVHADNGFGWAAFFNARPGDANGFSNDIDAALWTAFNGTTRWLNTNLFNQYGAYTRWLDGASYQAEFAAQSAAGRYPVRVEGANEAGIPLYRAVFAPSPGGSWESRHGIDCPTYQQRQSDLGSQGYQMASLQSYVASDGTRRYQATWVKW